MYGGCSEAELHYLLDAIAVWKTVMLLSAGRQLPPLVSLGRVYPHFARRAKFLLSSFPANESLGQLTTSLFSPLLLRPFQKGF